MGKTTELANPNGFCKIMGQREENSNNHPPQKILMIQIRRSDSHPMVIWLHFECLATSPHLQKFEVSHSHMTTTYNIFFVGNCHLFLVCSKKNKTLHLLWTMGLLNCRIHLMTTTKHFKKLGRSHVIQRKFWVPFMCVSRGLSVKEAV